VVDGYTDASFPDPPPYERFSAGVGDLAPREGRERCKCRYAFLSSYREHMSKLEDRGCGENHNPGAELVCSVAQWRADWVVRVSKLWRVQCRCIQNQRIERMPCAIQTGCLYLFWYPHPVAVGLSVCTLLLIDFRNTSAIDDAMVCVCA